MIRIFETKVSSATWSSTNVSSLTKSLIECVQGFIPFNELKCLIEKIFGSLNRYISVVFVIELNNPIFINDNLQIVASL